MMIPLAIFLVDVPMAIERFHRIFGTGLRLALGYWLFTCSTVLSFAVFTACTAIIFDKPWVWPKDFVTIRDIVVVDGGKKAVVLFATYPANTVGPRTSEIGVQALDSGPTALRTVWHELNPSCLALRG